MTPEQLRNCPSPAKLNLYLHVLGQRDDGYHNLETVFDLIDMYDSMHFSIRTDGAIMRRGGIHGLAHDNDLAVRAARLLAAASQTRLGVNIEITKRIPIGGGLGGGSSNAATTLLALNRLWGVKWPVTRLARLAAQLGADVPVFVHGVAALATGIGEKLAPIELPKQCYVVVAPPTTVPTTEIFSAPELTRDSKPLRISRLTRALIGLHGKNDLEPVACKRYPQVEKALLALSTSAREVSKLGKRGGRAGGSSSRATEGRASDAYWPQARMSGSGACVFIPVPGFDAAERIKDHVTQLDVGKAYVVRSLRRHPLRDWAFGRR